MVFQAGLVSFLRTLFIIAAIYFGLRWLFRFLIPFFLRRFIRKQQERYTQHSSYNQDEEGNVKVKHKKDQRSSKSDLGDYIDYEEIDDKESKQDG